MRHKGIIILTVVLILSIFSVLVVKSTNSKLNELDNITQKLEIDYQKVVEENNNLKGKIIESDSIITNFENEIELLNEKTDIQQSKIISLEDGIIKVDEEVLAHLEILNGSVDFLFDNTEGQFYYKGSDLINSTYSIEWPLDSLDYVSKYLSSFRELTEITENMLNQEQKNSIANLDWATQTLGFQNHMISVEGGVRDLAFILSKLEYELNIMKYEDGIININILNEKRDKYLSSKSDYEIFINNTTLGD